MTGGHAGTQPSGDVGTWHPHFVPGISGHTSTQHSGSGSLNASVPHPTAVPAPSTLPPHHHLLLQVLCLQEVSLVHIQMNEELSALCDEVEEAQNKG